MPEPTPEELGQRAERIGREGGTEEEITQLVADAEAAGDAHMAAVAAQVVRWPASGALPPVYDTTTGKPAYHETNILIECRIRVEGELMTWREAIDPYMFDVRFGEPAEFDHYLDYALRHAFGLMAADPKMGPIIRSKVWVVRPTDKHDFKRCLDSGDDAAEIFRDTDFGAIELNTSAPVDPYCRQGVIVRKPGQHTVGGVRRFYLSHTPLGACPCRCHQHDGSCYRAEQLLRVHRHFPMSWGPAATRFDEDQLDEEGNVRDA